MLNVAIAIFLEHLNQNTDFKMKVKYKVITKSGDTGVVRGLYKDGKHADVKLDKDPIVWLCHKILIKDLTIIK